ncbi:GPO family capsid scaffolding protein [Vibrio mediterranei]|uniref:GPO family capsid scaffolding protein n=1 Tax=Vibrio mediterranei TaxID=689 RepID=UPI001EFEEB0E|nr:GPO family capsid scaffolding protein [Vibrio mediterranei]MCG9664716.1 GPO family capsid scaffolding protein [Vibrio mediterranei]
MSKTSDWKIVATEGATVDGRQITTAWIKDMASLYSTSEYTAMIWPEHARSHWNVFEGKNWGVVEELKAEKKDDKLRLFAKITPNQYLLDANQDGQKLFTSIEPNPDYKGEGRCYLMGLAVTDSPASTGTDRLEFSRKQGEVTKIECSDLEELDVSECFTTNPISKFFSDLAKHFQTGGELPAIKHVEPEPEDIDVTPEQLEALFDEKFGALKGELVEEFGLKKPEPKPAPEVKPEGATVEQFSATLDEKLKPLVEKVTGLETKFNELSQEVPGQEPGSEGVSDTMEGVF